MCVFVRVCVLFLILLIFLFLMISHCIQTLKTKLGFAVVKFVSSKFEMPFSAAKANFWVFLIKKKFNFLDL